jgi:hypothetical protein
MCSLPSSENTLFPLPLVPLEMLFVLDDRDSHPMTCGAEFIFDGSFSRSRLSSAIEQAIARHPLFAASIEPGRNGRLYWVRSKTSPEVRWQKEQSTLTCQLPTRVDLFNEAGLRIKAYEDSRHTKLAFEFHHACSDGAGGLTFVEDVLAIYSNACHSRKLVRRELPPLQPPLLHKRGDISGASGLSWHRLKREWHDLADTVRFFWRPSSAIAQVSPRLFTGLEEDACTGRAGTVQLNVQETSQLRRAAIEVGGTLNDQLICSLLLTIHDWNARYGRKSAGENYRIMLPWNLRTRSEQELPATNFMSFAFLQRSAEELLQREGLLRSITAETNQIRQRGVPSRVLSKLGILRQIPGAFHLLLNREICHATAVLSNVGDPTRRFRTRFPREGGNIVAGDVVLTDFRAISPIRPQTHASFFVNTYGQRLSVTSWLNAARFAPAEAQQFVLELIGWLDPYKNHDDGFLTGRRHQKTTIAAVI